MRRFYRFQVFLQGLLWIHKEPSDVAIGLVILAVINMHLGGVLCGFMRIHHDLVGLGTAESVSRRDHARVFHLLDHPLSDVFLSFTF